MSVLDSCTLVGDLATSIMKGRQNGVNMAKALTIAKDSALSQKIVEMAYEHPRYSTDEYITREVENFTNDIISGCMKSGIQLEK